MPMLSSVLRRDAQSELVRYKQLGRANQKIAGPTFFWFRFLYRFKENELATGEKHFKNNSKIQNYRINYAYRGNP